jgi:ATP-dependent Clp protease ATP-binding subunit ClpC
MIAWRAVAALQLRPLVIARCHAEGSYSACPAFLPQLLAYSDHQQGAIDELVDFLSDYFAELSPDALQKFLITEEATVRDVSVVIPREDLPRGQRIRTPIAVPVIEVAAHNGAKWLLLPTLAQATYLNARADQTLEEAARNEILRLATASALTGAEYLDLLPALSFELLRPSVEVMRERADGKAGARARELRDAEKLLEHIGRKLRAPAFALLARPLAELRALLEAEGRTSVVLVGAEGAGKSAWLRAAAAQGPRAVYATSGAELVAGQSGLGQLEARLEAVVKAAQLLDAVLYFESLEDLFAGRDGGYEDIAGLLRRHLQAGNVRIVGELSVEAYDRLSQRHVGVFSYLQRFSVEPLSRAQTLEVLAARSNSRVRSGGRGLNAEASSRILALTERYEPYRVLPGKAVALSEELLQQASLSPDGSAPPELDADDVLAAFARKSGIPEFLLRDERSLLLNDVERFFRQHVVGQDRAVKRVAETLCAIKAGLQPAGKPLATLLFLGPTGVGKTELAKALARFLFGSTERMARFDMSEYTDALAADRLIRGSDRADGVLTRRVREQPFGVVLLDEIEKAHHSVFDLLLQVTGEGRLSDARGKIAYFHNTIIILTSNLGARHRRASVGFGGLSGGVSESDDESYYLGQVERHFRPELVGRLDSIVSFASLDRAQIDAVAALSVERITRRAGIEGRGSKLLVSPAALQALSARGFSADYGARGLRRYLEQALVAPLASLMSELGEHASGALLMVQTSDEPPVEAWRNELAGYQRSRLPPLTAGQLSLSAALSPKSERSQHDSGISQISDLRRSARRWLNLAALVEARGQLAERTIELTQNARRSTQFGARHSATRRNHSDLAREHAQLEQLLSPLDSALQSLETIESLLLAALDEAPPDLLPEATASFTRFKEQLVHALLRLTREDSLTFALHELDEHPTLSAVFLPLLRFCQQQKWECTLHFDHQKRTLESGWPSLQDRRWGPPTRNEDYLREPVEKPSGTVLLRVRGPGAGALLSLYMGRLRFSQSGGQLLLRPLAHRYELTDEDWAHRRFSASIDRQVAQREALLFDIDAIARTITPKGGHSHPLEPSQLFERWSSVLFERIVTKAASEEPFSAALE